MLIHLGLSKEDKLKEYKRNWYLKNQERLKLKSKQWYLDNKDAVLDKVNKYRKINKEKVNANKKAWAENNLEKVKKAKKICVDKNKGKYAITAKAWREKNKQKHSAQKEEWRVANKDIINSYTAKRRAEKLLATPKWFSELDKFVIQEAFDLAKVREKLFGFKWHVDHIIPLSAKDACGLHCADNIQVIPQRLNNVKCNKMILTKPYEWVGKM